MTILGKAEKCLILLNIQPHAFFFFFNKLILKYETSCSAEECPDMLWRSSADRPITHRVQREVTPTQNSNSEVQHLPESAENILRSENVAEQFLPGTCCTSPKNVNVRGAMFPGSVSRLADFNVPNVLTGLFVSTLCARLCSERWVTTNTVFKHPYLFSSGSKNKVEKSEQGLYCSLSLIILFFFLFFF